LATRTATYVVDTLAVTDLTPLAGVFAAPDLEVVFHDADYDLRILYRDFGLRVRGLFDTKLAAQFLGEPAIGLASLTEKYLGIRLEKKHQRADWAQRPLPDYLLEYAAEDTRHLPALRDRLKAELEARAAGLGGGRVPDRGGRGPRRAGERGRRLPPAERDPGPDPAATGGAARALRVARADGAGAGPGAVPDPDERGDDRDRAAVAPDRRRADATAGRAAVALGAGQPRDPGGARTGTLAAGI